MAPNSGLAHSHHDRVHLKVKYRANTGEAPKLKTGAAAWNSAGTYEESNLSEWAKGRLEALLESMAATLRA